MAVAIVIFLPERFSLERVNFHDVFQWQMMDYLEVSFNLFFAFELYYSLFHILMIKSSYRVDRDLFNFLFNSYENSPIGHSLFWS